MRNLAYFFLSALTLFLVVLLARSLLDQGKPLGIPQRVEAGFQEDLTVENLQVMGGLPAYWLGETYRGLPIVKIRHRWDPGSPDGVRRPREDLTIIYASCKPGQPPEGESTEGYCPQGEKATFVSVTSEWLCLKPPSLLVAGARKGLPVKIRGGQVQKTTSGNTHFYFANSTVIIFASEGEEITLEAFEDLKGINPPGKAIALAARVPLGPPIPEEQCKNFILPTPQPIATPTITPTATLTTTPQPMNTPTPPATVTPTPTLGGS